jgi:hypothetical protein
LNSSVKVTVQAGRILIFESETPLARFMRTAGIEGVSLMQLPDRPNLRHLRDQAKDRLRSGAAATLAEAQLRIAREYGFPSWTKLKQHVDSLDVRGQLQHAIAANDVPAVRELLTSKA